MMLGYAAQSAEPASFGFAPLDRTTKPANQALKPDPVAGRSMPARGSLHAGSAP
jgi:hypothetical protein